MDSLSFCNFLYPLPQHTHLRAAYYGTGSWYDGCWLVGGGGEDFTYTVPPCLLAHWLSLPVMRLADGSPAPYQ